MEALFLEVIKFSPVCAILLLIWYYQKRDYTKLVEDTREDSKDREKRYQEIIDKLADKFSVVEDIKKDVQTIDEKLNVLEDKLLK